MKKILILTLPLMVMCFASCEKEEEWTDDSPIIQFKDPYFLERLLHTTYSSEDNTQLFPIDRNQDGQISEKEASIVQRLLLVGDIRNIDEIKYFTSLTSLDCSDNELTSLNLSNNSLLEELRCGGNQLATLDVSGCLSLASLDCSDNKLTSLDLSKNTALDHLFCGRNKLTTLNVGNNTLLTVLVCSDNKLTSLDLSKNTLVVLGCSGNELTFLDLSKNTALTELYCENNKLTSLDVSNNMTLTELRCYSNDITSLDVSMCRGLKNLYCAWPNDSSTKLPLTSLKIYKYHILNNISQIEEEYGDIIEYVE